jgi:hypothetical protein
VIEVLAALLVCAELAGTIAFAAGGRSEQVVEAAPARTPLPQAR